MRTISLIWFSCADKNALLKRALMNNPTFGLTSLCIIIRYYYPLFCSRTRSAAKNTINIIMQRRSIPTIWTGGAFRPSLSPGVIIGIRSDRTADDKRFIADCLFVPRHIRQCTVRRCFTSPNCYRVLKSNKVAKTINRIPNIHGKGFP
jgi:hypothetical protein